MVAQKKRPRSRLVILEMRSLFVSSIFRHKQSRRGTQVARLLLLVGLLICACTTTQRSDPLTRLRAAGGLRIAIDPAFPPFEFVDSEGALVGLDVDLGRQIAARLGMEAHFVTTGYDALYDALMVGRADVIISALYPDPSRMQAFVFSRSYFNAGEVLLVPDMSAIAAVDDLPGRRVALVFGTAAHVAALRWEKTLQPPPVLLVKDDPQAVVALLADGQADAAVVDHVTARIAVAHTAGLRVLLPPITDEPYVVAARKEDADLVEAVDEVLEALQTDGTLDALVGQWMR